jgi:hypothetical protein
LFPLKFPLTYSISIVLSFSLFSNSHLFSSDYQSQFSHVSSRFRNGWQVLHRQRGRLEID